MLRKFKLILAVLFATALQSEVFAQTSIALPCKDDDRRCAAEMRSQSAVKKLPFWESALRKPIEQRIGSAPNELVIYLNLDNIAGGVPNKPRPTAIPYDFLTDVNDAIAELPEQVKRLASRKLAGIYFVKDLGGTGYTDFIDTGTPSLEAGFIVLDIDVLSTSNANGWATWKERTPFTANPRYRLDAIIEINGQDNRKNAIQYILLHELGHVVSLGEKTHPQWGQQKDKAPVESYSFARLSWETGDHNDIRYRSRFERQFPLRKDVVYYFGAKLNGDQMADAYRQLENTNFPTLYAATSPADDFAESFASYVHTVLLKRPLEIRIYHDDRLTETYRSCWEQKRCADKRRFLDDLLKPR